MKRKDYEKPTIQVVELQHMTVLLSGSGGKGMLGGYTNDGGDAWGGGSGSGGSSMGGWTDNGGDAWE